MRLQENPFFILNISCSADRKTIVAAAEERSLFVNSAACVEAQNTLLSVTKRLSAEVDWFPDANELAINEIRNSIEKSSPLPTDGLTSLSLLNATLYNFCNSSDEDCYEVGYTILDIDEQFSSLHIESIVDCINEIRERAHFSKIKSQELRVELDNKRSRIRKEITERLSALNEDAYVELVTLLSEKCVAATDYNDGPIIADIIDQYEIRIQSKLEQMSGDIENQIRTIQGQRDEQETANAVNELIKSVASWDIIAQPLQVKAQASGMPHEISEELGRELRDLALYLHNERGLTQLALDLVVAMRKVFAELEYLAEWLQEDYDALKDIISDEKNAKELTDSLDNLRKLSEEIKASPSVEKVNRFISDLISLDRKLFSIELNAVAQENLRESLCYLGRGTAVALHNERQQTELALTIATALQNEFGNISTLSAKLSEDVRTLESEKRAKARMSSAMQRTTNGNSNGKNRDAQTAMRLLGIIAAIAVLVSVVSSNSTNKSGQSHTSTAQTSTTSSNSYSNSVAGTTNSGASGSRREKLKEELDQMSSKISSMEYRLKTMQIEIDDMESQLEDLASDIDDYESQYYSTGADYYYNAYYDTVDEYNAIFEEYDDAINNYSSLYETYSNMVDSYNRKVSEYNNS